MRNDELYHYGVVGMKWGVRRYQRKDGTWTGAGKARRKRTEHHARKKLTSAQKEKIKKAAKIAGISAAAVGAGVGTYFLAKKFGPKALSSMKNVYIKNIKGPDIPRAEAIKQINKNNDLIDYITKSIVQRNPRGSKNFIDGRNMIRDARNANRKLFETKVRTGIQDATNAILRAPNDISIANTKSGSQKIAEFIAKNGDKLAGIGGAAGVGAGATFMNHLVDNAIDRPRAKRNTKRNKKTGENYNYSTAKYADYMFPNPNKKK